MGLSRNKGSKNVRRCIAFLESQDWNVANIERKGRHLKEKDAYGIGDLMGVKDYRPYIQDKRFRQDRIKTAWMLIQVTSNKPHTMKMYKEFAKSYCSDVHLLRQYVFVDRKGFKVYDYTMDGEYTVTELYGDDYKWLLKVT